jgi:hypothetical protein
VNNLIGTLSTENLGHKKPPPEKKKKTTNFNAPEDIDVRLQNCPQSLKPKKLSVE